MNETIGIADKLILFSCVAKHLNFRAAATELNIPVATLSRKISELESHLGLQLLQRTTRSVNLTRAGIYLNEQIISPLGQLEQAILQSQEQHKNIRGKVRIATTSILASTNILPVLPKLGQHYPELQIELLVDDEVVDLRFEQIDFAIRAGKIEDTSLIARRLGEHVFALYSTNRWKDVPDPPFIAYDDVLVSEWMNYKNARLIVKDLHLIKQTVLSGQGEAYLPTVFCQDEEQAGSLIRRHNAPSYSFDFYLVYPSRQYLSVSVRCVMDALINFAASKAAITN